MRTLKPEKYEQMRKLLSTFLGSPVLRIFKDHAQQLDLDPDVFNLVYEGFWDLYTFHPQLREVSARKLQGWIQRIKLVSGPDRSPVAEEDKTGPNDDSGPEEEEVKKPQSAGAQLIEGEDVYDKVTAVIRLKIPKVPLEPEIDDDGNPIPVEVDESDLEDIPFEDRCLQSMAKIDDQQVWVLNHLAQKALRTEISAEFR